VCLAPTTITLSKAGKSVVLTLWMTHHPGPQLSQALKIPLWPVSSHSSTLIEVDLTSDFNKGSLVSTGFYVMERAGVPNALYTQCIFWWICAG
jgi:hypothetical protein